MRRVSELLREAEKPTWIVNDVLTAGDLHLLYGRKLFVEDHFYSARKLAAEFARCVARGTPFYGKDTTQGGVLYISRDRQLAKLFHETELQPNDEVFVLSEFDKISGGLREPLQKQGINLVIVDDWEMMNAYSKPAPVEQQASINLHYLSNLAESSSCAVVVLYDRPENDWGLLQYSHLRGMFSTQLGLHHWPYPGGGVELLVENRYLGDNKQGKVEIKPETPPRTRRGLFE